MDTLRSSMALYQAFDKEELIRIGMTLEEAEVFGNIHATYIAIRSGQRSHLMNFHKVSPPPEHTIIPYPNLSEPPKADLVNLLNKLVVVKLNGGLGTRMGMEGPKSAVELRNDQTFLDVNVRQIQSLNKSYGVDIPLALMNSFYTDKATKRIIQKYSNQIQITTFKQSKFPRLYKDTLRPLPKPIGKKTKEEDFKHWSPPGSGDVYRSLHRAGLLEKYLKEGKEYIFISSIENVGATVDFRILNYVFKNRAEFTLEVTNRTSSDYSGGVLIQEGGRIKLLETLQIPVEQRDRFNTSDFAAYNTNSMWVSISSLIKLIATDSLELSFVTNTKEFEGHDILQLETPAGTAIQSFYNPFAIFVTRDRFFPVKNTAHLFLMQSNLFELRDDGQMIMSPKREFPTLPIIKFGDNFHNIAEYRKRFKQIPDILELDQLTVSGDVTFGTGITLKGTVIIVAGHNERIDIPPGAVLENKIISGTLNIFDT